MEENRCRARSVIGEVEKSVVGKNRYFKKSYDSNSCRRSCSDRRHSGNGKDDAGAFVLPVQSDSKVNRVQFTPDVLPADLSGFTIYDKASGAFVYQPGAAAICNLLFGR